MTTEYILDSTSKHGRQQIDLLGAVLDERSREFVAGTGIGPGWRCLEIGAGGGSMADWLARRSGASGHVLAIDIKTDQLSPPPPGVEVLCHDINDGVPGGGPFDLIHARLVLLHLSRREQILRTLVDALAPGGWLVLGDYSGRLPYAVAARDADRELFDRIQDVGHHTIGRAAGQSLRWAHATAGHLALTGLSGIDAVEHSFVLTGGDAAARYHRSLIAQLRAAFVDAGITGADVDRCCELLLDPSFRAWSYQLVYTRGRRADMI